mmetsp:Transcript_24975/g.39239  ORF Transcript_24975/g.39239 Transcript_24975/m.39239 type:complete len:619 (+) Transcript_24975:3-1859(+)
MMESFHRMSNCALIAYAVGAQGLYLGVGGEILFTMILGNRLMTFLEDPVSNFKFLARELFDTCGLYHGFGKLPSSFRMDGSSDIVGRVNLRDAIIKAVSRTISQIVILSIAAAELNQNQQLPASSTPSVLVILSGICIGIHVLLLAGRAYLHKLRQKHLVQKRRLFQMEAWSTRIFEKTSPEFIEAVNEYLIPCKFFPGDYIVKQGEQEPVLHIITKGVAFRKRQGRDSSASRAGFKRIPGSLGTLGRSNSLWFSKFMRQNTEVGSMVKDSVSTTGSRYGSMTRDSGGNTSPSKKQSHAAYDRIGFDYRSILLTVYRNSPEILEMCEEDLEMQLLPKGSTIGESGLMNNETHPQDVIARSTVETQALSGEAYKLVLQRFPKMAHRIHLRSEEEQQKDDYDINLTSFRTFMHSPSTSGTNKANCPAIQLEKQMLIPSIKRGLLYEKARGKPQAALMLTVDLGTNAIHAEMDLCEDLLHWEIHYLLQVPGRSFSVESRKYPRFLICFQKDEVDLGIIGEEGLPKPPEALAGQLFSMVHEKSPKLDKFLLTSKITDVEKVATHGLVLKHTHKKIVDSESTSPKRIKRLEGEAVQVYADTGFSNDTAMMSTGPGDETKVHIS